MHSKKAQVPKEEYEAIRQCQQEERERKRQGIRHPWQMSTSTVTPPAPPRHNMESPGTMQAGNIPQSQRKTIITSPSLPFTHTHTHTHTPDLNRYTSVGSRRRSRR